MTQAIEQKIRERAYEIWVATGCENGLADLHWLSAEQAVIDEAVQPDAKGRGRVAGAGKSAGKSAGKVEGMAAKAPAKARPGKNVLPATVTVRKRAKKEQVGQA